MTISPQAGPTLAYSQPTSSSRRYFTIGQLAKEFGLTLRALRFYEDRGLLSPQREGHIRIYRASDRERLAVILKAKALGFTLSEIKALAAEAPQAERLALSLSAAQTADQIAHLEQQQAEIDAALRELRTERARLLATSAT
jgi:DNA-binding transcriptional MerR regulator